MEESSAGLRREAAVQVLLPLFFLSGATGLVYQTLWARRLHLVFGTSTLAVTTVLAAFMAGLALGAWALGRRADRIERPLRAYGLLEIGIGVFALAFPFLIDAVTPLWLAIGRALPATPVAFGLAQFVVLAPLLLLPTALMGATLPLLARFCTERLGAAGDRVGVLYGVNTAGAVFGTWLAGFVLLPRIGWGATNGLAAGANVVLGVAAIALASWAHDHERAPVEADLAAPVAAPPDRRVLWALFLAGFASLVYEVAWTRVVGLVIGGSVYAFSLMLLAFLSGIAIGGAAGGRLADRVLERGGVVGVLGALAVVEIGVGVLAGATLFLFPQLPFAYVAMFDVLGGGQSNGAVWVGSLFVAGLVMLPPTVLMGAAFPLAVRAVVRDADALGAPVGRLYAANTVGAVLGAFAAGFVLVPLVGLRGAVLVGVAGNALAAALLLVRAARDDARWRPVLAGAVVLAGVAPLVRAPWDPLLMTSGLYRDVAGLPDHSREGIRKWGVGQYELLFYEEGLGAVVTVVRNPRSGNVWLANNGKIDASSQGDMPTQVLLGAAPMIYSEDPRHVLVIGLASGATAGTVSLVPDVERLDVVEIEPAVVRAAALFAPWNFDVLDDPRTVVHVADGRNHLLLAEPATWDVVISEPPNPWLSGVANLFTLEFFTLGKSRVKAGGVWCQWIQTYALDPRDLESLLRTFAEVWPYVVVYVTPTHNDLAVIGSDRPIHAGPPYDQRPWTEWPALGEVLEQNGIDRPAALTSAFILDRPAVLAYAGDAPLNTDDNVRIEYHAPLSLHRATASTNRTLMVRYETIPFEAYDGDPEGLAEVARMWRRREDWARAIIALRLAVDLLPPDDERRDVWTLAAARWEADLAMRTAPD